MKGNCGFTEITDICGLFCLLIYKRSGLCYYEGVRK